MAATSGIDLLLVSFEALSPEEREMAFERLAEARLRHRAADGSLEAGMLSSLLAVADHAGTRDLSPDVYRAARRELVEAGQSIETFNRVVRHYGTWRQAKEAVVLSGVTTTQRIESRFRSRRLGKIWRYTDEVLEETLRRCAEQVGSAPMVAELEWWRDRELELARARGEDAAHLPSATPYRKRWGSWQGALLHVGFSKAEIDARYGQRRVRVGASGSALEPPA